MYVGTSQPTPPSHLMLVVVLVVITPCVGCHPFEDINDYPFAADVIGDTTAGDGIGVPDAIRTDTACACEERPNAVGHCKVDGCAYVCLSGTFNCDGDMTNGCERLDTAKNCGACGETCGDSEVCKAGQCMLSCGGELCPDGVCSDVGCEAPCSDSALCSDGFSCCNGNCTNTNSDPERCGTCGTVCPNPPNASATCEASLCTFACDEGFGDCNGNASDGCEKDLSLPAHCGSCDVNCTVFTSANVIGAGCDGGCIYDCEAGFDTCGDAGPCMTNLLIDPAHCGECDKGCDPGTSCVDGSCVDLPPCGELCGATQTCCQGTCVDMLVNPDNCGSCGSACLAGQGCCEGNCSDLGSTDSCGACGVTCTNAETCCSTGCADLLFDEANCGACGAGCGTGQTCCEGACVDTQLSQQNCGACGAVCQGSCDQGSCVVSSTCAGGCASGSSCCNGGCVSLETATDCGACGAPCDGVCATGGTCEHQACGDDASCPLGQSCCAGKCYDTDISSDNCGSCGYVCSTGRCLAGGCG